MIFEFKTTANNTYHRRNYLAFDTEKRIFTRNNTRFVVEGIEIKTRDYKEMIERLKKDGFSEVDDISA